MIRKGGRGAAIQAEKNFFKRKEPGKGGVVLGGSKRPDSFSPLASEGREKGG